MKRIIRVCIFFLVASSSNFIDCVIIGSNTAVSRQALASFPSTDSNNTMLGFASFENGFTLASITTTCLYDDFFPVYGPITMNGAP